MRWELWRHKHTHIITLLPLNTPWCIFVTATDPAEVTVTQMSLRWKSQRRMSPPAGSWRRDDLVSGRKESKYLAGCVLNVLWPSPVWLQTTRTTCWKRKSTWALTLKSLILTKVAKQNVHTHTKPSWKISHFSFTLTLTLLLAEMQKFSKWEHDKRKEKMCHWLVQRLNSKLNTSTLPPF